MSFAGASTAQASHSGAAPSDPPELASIQEPVREDLARVAREIRRIVRSDFELVDEVNAHLLHMPGKLFRPTLVLLSGRVAGEPDESALTLAAVVELVHLATLVHDDAVDHSVMRRGQPTVNAVWTHQVAIIMGDYLYSRGVTELARLGDLPALEVLARAANEMSVGEMRQLTSYDAPGFSEEDYRALIAAKTASLMSAACEMGAISGGGAHREALAEYGHNLGMAFQIADDLLDYAGVEEVTGKPSRQDLRERKVTLPLVAAMAAASESEKEEVVAFFAGGEPTDEEIDRLIRIVRARGGLDYARARARTYGQRAEAALDGLPDGEALAALKDAVWYAVDRRR